MNKILTYLILAFLSLCLIPVVHAQGAGSGYNGMGRLVVAPTLVKICGLSAEKPTITDECYQKLAKHLNDGETGDTELPTYAAERAAIFNDYAKAYLREAAIEMQDAGAHEDEVNKKVGKDPSTKDTQNNDRRQFIENNTAIASANTARILFAATMRSQAIKVRNVQQSLNYLVPEMAEELKKDSDSQKTSGE